MVLTPSTPPQLFSKSSGVTGTTRGDYLTILIPNEDPGNLKLLRDHTFRTNPAFRTSTCPLSLQLKMKDADWTLAGKYHPEIQMLMSEELVDQSEYRRLQTFSIPYGLKMRPSLSYDDLARILSLFPASESIFEFPDGEFRPSCIRCAVVGNGGILNGSARGREIDDHHMVFRLNNAIRRGHEVDVGNRTTHYFFYDRSLQNMDKRDVPTDKGIKYVFIPCRHNDYVYIKRVVNGWEPKIHASATDVRILHPDFIRYVQRIWMGNSELSSFYRPSTGALMLFTALHAGCDRVQVFGMGYQLMYSVYYYDADYQRPHVATSVHDLAKETELMDSFNDAGIIDWYQRRT
ncbi:alpha-N-acetylgalactosaminide alpha-2,6-sialyltransferase 2-like [Asterias rubens]|uniref:alpha-N-acetylgalactosaminide alpha-2,6-sialyltransferase 2-like n=1 Tax=Asterias rubens TaxID=7604 RepID=UPI0014558C00|nr:alpha-N-acetylgalactosaminide alpha-2,6-sialyltransferase 2-like [Asterias rubens]